MKSYMGQAIMGHKSRLFVGAAALLPLLFGCSQSPAADCEVALGKKGAAEDGEYFEIDPVSLSATVLTCVGASISGRNPRAASMPMSSTTMSKAAAALPVPRPLSWEKALLMASARSHLTGR
jgi:hypothetical protein